MSPFFSHISFLLSSLFSSLVSLFFSHLPFLLSPIFSSLFSPNFSGHDFGLHHRIKERPHLWCKLLVVILLFISYFMILIMIMDEDTFRCLEPVLDFHYCWRSYKCVEEFYSKRSTQSCIVSFLLSYLIISYRIVIHLILSNLFTPSLLPGHESGSYGCCNKRRIRSTNWRSKVQLQSRHHWNAIQ